MTDQAAVTKTPREMALEEVARDYHEAIAKTFEEMARKAMAEGYAGWAEDHRAVAAKHREHAREIRAQVWRTKPPTS